MFLAAVVAGLLVGGVVAGVRAVSRDSSDTAGNGAQGTGTATAPAGTARATAEQFAAAWSRDDTDALYLLLDPAVQQRYPLTDFTSAYQGFEDETTLTSLAASVASVDGGSARLAVHATTAYFGDLEYTISLNLVQVAGRWLVAWEPAALHPELTAGVRFRSTIQRPTRGAILDRNGEPLAVTRDVRLLGLNRAAISDRGAVTAALVGFGFTREQVDSAFANRGGPSQRIAVGPVPDDRVEAAAALAHDYAGVLLYFEAQRVHPLGAAAAHVVGYTRELTAEELAQRKGQGLRVGDRVGAVGLEATQEKVLAGQAGAELDLVDEQGAVRRVLQQRDFVQGQDVKTTLDASVLRATAARLAGRAGAAVVVDPRSNAILALNSSPSYDPDAFERNDAAALAAITAASGSPQANRATAGLYSAGSTFKLITGAAGLAYGGYTPTDRIECSAVWTGVDPPRRNWEGAQGPLTIAQGLMRSCNPVFYEIALKLYNTQPPGLLAKMARAFGLGAPTGVVGLAEEDGLVPDAQWKKEKKGELWFPGDEVNLGIGQGDLLLTPLQLANAYSTFLAGDLRAPVILAGQQATSRGRLPLTAEQSAALKLGLRLVTGPNGTASAAFANAGYTDFGGKSGTAEDVGAQQHVLFVAFSPAADPHAVAAVVLDEGQSGSIEAGPIARDIVLAALKASP